MTIKEYIDAVHGGNKLKASKSLNISRRMIYKYLQGDSFPVRIRVLKSLKSAGIDVPKL